MLTFRGENCQEKSMDDFVVNVEFGRSGYTAECEVYQGLFWILDKRSHAINLQSISFTNDDNTAMITLSNGVVSAVTYHDNVELVREIIKKMEVANNGCK